MEMTKKIYLETLKSLLGHSILHYCWFGTIFLLAKQWCVKIWLKWKKISDEWLVKNWTCLKCINCSITLIRKLVVNCRKLFQRKQLFEWIDYLGLHTSAIQLKSRLVWKEFRKRILFRSPAILKQFHGGTLWRTDL